MRVVVVIVVLAWSSFALAQPAKPRVSEKHHATAYVLASLGTLAPIGILVASNSTNRSDAILIAGVTGVLAPSAGHWYAGEAFTPGMGIRIAGGLVAIVGLGFAVSAEEDDRDSTAGEAVFWVGTGALAAGAIYDIATAGSAVDAWNKKHTEIAPTVMKTGAGYGIGLAGRF